MDDHNPPHIHAKYAEHEAGFDLDGNMITGKFPPKQQRFVSAWVELNKDAIEANIENLKENQPVIQIEE